jgi:hypothetical protein
VNLSRIFTVLTFASLPVVAFASGCSGGSSGGGSSSGGNSSGGTGIPTTRGGTGTGGGTGTSSGGTGSSADSGTTDAQCQEMTSAENCVACCADLHGPSYLTFIDAILGCECSADGGLGTCQAQCANEYCAKQNPKQGDACDLCLIDSLVADAGGQCLGPVSQICSPGGPCDGYLGCANGCHR